MDFKSLESNLKNELQIRKAKNQARSAQARNLNRESEKVKFMK